LKLYEFQSKAYFADFGIPIPASHLVETPEQTVEAAKTLGGRVVLKAQVLASNRDRVGGIRYADNPDDVYKHAQILLGSEIHGFTVQKLLVDEAIDIQERLYLAITNDRVSGRPVLIASTQGGTYIEDIALQDPETVLWEHIDPLIGLRDYQIRRLCSNLNLPRDLWKDFHRITWGLYRCYTNCDATLVEINPLVITTEHTFIAVDGKLVVDDNALFRQPEIATLLQTNVGHRSEATALEAGLTYIKLAGQIGCMVNGAGMAMTVMDMIRRYSNNQVGPANFLDIRGGATSERIATALDIILSDADVQTVLISIFGGITHCDVVARGIIAAVENINTTIPLVIRLKGTNAELARSLLQDSQLPHLIIGDSLMNTVHKAIMAAEGHMHV